LTSLMIQPRIKPSHIDLFRKGVRSLEKELEDASSSKDVLYKVLDMNAINRLAASFHRLHLRTDLGDELFRGSTEYVLSNIREFELQYAQSVRDDDCATYLRYQGFASERLPFYFHENKTVFEVFQRLRDIRDETGCAVPLRSLCESFDEATVENAVGILMNRGKVFQVRDGVYDVV
ncbi:MAG: hypothetical protein L0Z54_03350, partial [Thermoplasmata archaeon]|nr:hypothetical protein [Thermoplasmata archaeon]